MNTHERRLGDHHNPEKIPGSVIRAIKRVPIDEYLKMRTLAGIFDEKLEAGQIVKAAKIVTEYAQKRGKSYDLKDPLPLSGPAVFFARQRVMNVPLPQYLAIRREVLEDATRRTTSLICHEEDYLFRDDKKIEEKGMRLMILETEFNLTNMVIASLKV
jgi:hypothetical protein